MDSNSINADRSLYISTAVLKYDEVVQKLANARTEDKNKILNYYKHTLNNQIATLKHLKCRNNANWRTRNCNVDPLIHSVKEFKRFDNTSKINELKSQFEKESDKIDNDFHFIQDVLSKLSMHQERIK